MDEVDRLLVRAYQTYIEELKQYRNTRFGRGPIGGGYYAGTSSISANVPFGAATFATPDGRKAGAPLAEGASPASGTDHLGPTAVFNSLAKLPTEAILGGVLLNQKLNPATLDNPRDREKLMLMLRTFFESYRGWHVQYNIVSRETLLAAKQHPDQYRDLVVRVAGYSAFFTALSLRRRMILLRAQNILFKPLTLSGRTWRPHHQADMNLRQQTILQLVNDRRRISVNELARASGVSEVTIRQDLNLLEKRSYLKRVHGSAVALESDDVDARMMSNFTLKQRLAQYAAAQVNDGETIFIESGSANALLARYIAERKRITLITVSHYIANLLKETDCDVIVLGGMYQKKSETVVGPLTRLCIQQVHFNKAFIGIDGFQAETGFTGRDMMRADVVSAVLAKGVENIVLTDSSKFGQISPTRWRSRARSAG